jgi:hypothetical protein
LRDRARYLIENLATLELNGEIGLLDIRNEPAHSLMRKLIHVDQELVVRNEKFEPMFLKSASVPNAMLGKEVELKNLNKLAINKKPHLIKFGEKEYLEKYSFKVSLASSFSDPSLNAAQMDEEMKAIYTPHPNDVEITKLDGTEIKGVKSIQLTYTAPRDYYVFCSSLVFDVRLFGDFKYDACLFIYNSQQFSNDLFKEVSNRVSVEDHGHKNVTYVDPIRPEKGNPPPVEFHKHIKYSYQNEFRHVFIPRSGTSTPKDIFLSMPEVANYSELICL